MGLFTPLGTPPNSGDPGTFNSRADALLGQLPTMVARFNELGPLLMSKYRATRSGSANAIVLTAGYDSLPVGTQVRFRAASTNTGAVTINLDGLGAIACLTVTGIALPAGYIRTDADTVATYNGSNWVVDRQIERGSNANGSYVRFADGMQICHADISIPDINAAAGSIFRSSVDVSWNFPASFATTIGLTVPAPGIRISLFVWGRQRLISTSGSSVLLFATTSLPGPYVADVAAIGRWF